MLLTAGVHQLATRLFLVDTDKSNTTHLSVSTLSHISNRLALLCYPSIYLLTLLTTQFKNGRSI
ncbi:MAG: hypothetical protein ACI82S_002750 [Patiriisocius sp.]|jgi:hypothetical protein